MTEPNREQEDTLSLNDRVRNWARPIYKQLSEGLSKQVNDLVEADAEGAEAEAETDAVHFTELLLEDAVRERATDLHLEPYAEGVRVRFRIDGVLLDTISLPAGAGGMVLRHLKALCGIDPVPTVRPVSAGRSILIGGQVTELRTTVAPCVFGEKVAVRLLDAGKDVQRLGGLGLDAVSEQQVGNWLEHVAGTFIVCGPTGSGKTTTLYSLLHELKNMNRSVVTVEDPVEYRIDGVTQIQVDRAQKLDFAEGLRAMLRLDPDHLMLGEIRDLETARVAMTAAGTGRVLMTTLHSKDAVGVLTALRNWGIDDFQTASALRVVVAQRLIRKLCPSCREEIDTPDNIEKEWLRTTGRDLPERMWRAVGCGRCNDVGYRGRTGIFEVWRVNSDDSDRILERMDDHRMRAALTERGHKFMIDDALTKVGSGVLDLREVRHLFSGR